MADKSKEKEDNNKRDNEANASPAFEYALPRHDSTDDTESNKSTPFFTPLEYCHSTFEFPSPSLEHMQQDDEHYEDLPSTTTPTTITTPTTSILTKKKQQAQQQQDVQQQSQAKANTSPVICRKLRRFSLYERRSCSPQHLLLKANSTTTSSTAATATIGSNITSTTPTMTTIPTVGGNVIRADKENKKPLLESTTLLANESCRPSANNSPTLPPDLTTTSAISPKILAAYNCNEGGGVNTNRLTYSPKLLSSINNLNLGSGSPLNSVLSSAGYKSGNYFKFPEIDHNILPQQQQQQQQLSDLPKQGELIVNPPPNNNNNINILMTKCNNENNQSNLLRIISSTSSSSSGVEAARKVKNKNNLTIKIKDAQTMPVNLMPNVEQSTTTTGSPTSMSGAMKPRTPTLKASKEKALSLDSCDSMPVIPAISHVSATPSAVDEIDAQQPAAAVAEQLRVGITANRSTSLVHLSSYAENNNKPTRCHMRRRQPGVDWLAQRKSCDKPELGQDTDNSYFMSSVLSGGVGVGGISRHAVAPMLNVVSSNTNLKTLPEFLTLVEFSSASSSAVAANMDDDRNNNNNNSNNNSISSSSMFAFKQKSMDLPNSATGIGHTARAISAANSSTNLLQRRGSNHSLTLNLHGSCSNLLSNCRTGISISNYNLGAVANSRSSGNLVGKLQLQPPLQLQQHHQLPHPCTKLHGLGVTTSSSGSSQCVKQSLFRRRGSNQSFTLNASINATSMDIGAQQALTTASCSNLNVMKATQTSTTATTTPKRGLLERRGSNQSLTLNMHSSFGGVGSSAQRCAEQLNLLCTGAPTCEVSTVAAAAQTCEGEHARKFYSSESLHRASVDMRHAKQTCYSSVADLPATTCAGMDSVVQAPSTPTACHTGEMFDQCGTNCSCQRMRAGVRHIATRPLSPQATSEEFKIYLANIQMLQSASNALNLQDLLKLTYTFDNSYTTNSYLCHQPHSLLDNHGVGVSSLHKEATSNSEDNEVAVRYQRVVEPLVKTLQLGEEEQKRIFRDLHKEFWDLPLNHQEKPMVFGSQTKNRYRTILPNENSRFMLDREHVLLDDLLKRSGASSAEEAMSEEVPYINANYIKGPDYTSKCYVATQGPLPNTVYDFWLMVFQNTQRYLKLYVGPEQSQGHGQQYFQKIIMLTNFMECNRQKCAVYFPIELNEIFITTSKQEVVTANADLQEFFDKYLNGATNVMSNTGIETVCVGVTEQVLKVLPPSANSFVIKNIGIVRKNGYSLRKFVVLYCLPHGDALMLINRVYCYHYWYPDWPDHRSPHDINTLLDMSLHMLNLGKCEAEFELFDVPQTPPAHMLAQSVELYQHDIYNAVQPLPIIHCSAGIGRTGCLTAILNAIRQLRQSLSYSLCAMAAAATAKNDSSKANKFEPLASNVLSPVDFNLPAKYLEEFRTLLRTVLEFNSDTDSSFTCNTLMYMHYIVLMHDSEVAAANMSEKLIAQLQRQIPLMLALPKLPEVVVDILGIVCNLRLQRGGMVQNSEQYELIHRAICLYLKRTFALKRF